MECMSGLNIGTANRLAMALRAADGIQNVRVVEDINGNADHYCVYWEVPHVPQMPGWLQSLDDRRQTIADAEEAEMVFVKDQEVDGLYWCIHQKERWVGRGKKRHRVDDEKTIYEVYRTGKCTCMDYTCKLRTMGTAVLCKHARNLQKHITRIEGAARKARPRMSREEYMRRMEEDFPS